MRSMIAFMKKEVTDQVRSGKLFILIMLFALFGIMNPAIAKLTPWLLDMMADSLAESGMTITNVTVSAMDSWVQFFKNLPMGLIAFVLLESSIFTKEYSSGTLVLSLTKGLERYKVVLSKAEVLNDIWTLCYLVCFGITYIYNDYFWDNSIAKNIVLAAFVWWLFGIFVISLVTLFSTLSSLTSGVYLGIGGVIIVCYFTSLVPKIAKYLPTKLTDGTSLIYGSLDASTYLPAIIITTAVTLTCFAVSVPLFNKKQL